MTLPKKKKSDAERTDEAIAEMDRYCLAHPRSPSATRRPRIVVRGNNCVVLLGSTLQDGIVGIGGTAEAALHAFDLQYGASLKAVG